MLLNDANPNDQVVKIKALEAFQAAADGKATKIIIPSEIQGLAGLATSAKALMEGDKYAHFYPSVRPSGRAGFL